MSLRSPPGQLTVTTVGIFGGVIWWIAFDYYEARRSTAEVSRPREFLGQFARALVKSQGTILGALLLATDLTPTNFFKGWIMLSFFSFATLIAAELPVD